MSRQKTTEKLATSQTGKRPSELGRKFGRRKGPGRPKLTELPTTKQLQDLEKKRKFITALAKYGTILRACKESGLSYAAYYLWTSPTYGETKGFNPPDRYYDAEFVEACAEAKLLHDQRILDTGYQRAIDGWVNTHYDSRGNVLREEFRYDSSILQMLMKRSDPQLKEKAPEINVDARQQTVNIGSEALDNLSPQQKRLLLQAARLEQRSPSEQGASIGASQPQGDGS